MTTDSKNWMDKFDGLGLFGGDSGSQAPPGNTFLEQLPVFNQQDGYKGKDPMPGMMIDPGWAKRNPDKAEGELINSQWQDFMDRYAPLEEEAIAKAMNMDFSGQAAAAGGYVGAQFDAQQGALDRNLGRYGLSPNAAQRQVSEDALQRARALGVVHAENRTRTELRDRNMQALADLASQGRGIASNSMKSMGLAGDLKSQRDQVGDQMDAQYKQGLMGGALSGAATGFAFGGPIGAVIGGAAGLLLGSI